MIKYYLFIILGSLGCVMLKTLVDYYQHKRKIKINKPLELTILLVVTLPFSFLFAYNSYYSPWIIATSTGINQLVGMLFFWIVFDAVFGWLLVKDINYVGKTSILDNNSPKKGYLLVKTTSFVLFSVFYFLLYYGF